MIVFDDADLSAVVDGIRTFGYYNAGQNCTAARRLYAGAKVYERLVAYLSGAVKTLKMGTQDEYGCTWINTHFMFVSEMPHGGLKSSGYGKNMSMYALEDYTVARHVMVRH